MRRLEVVAEAEPGAAPAEPEAPVVADYTVHTMVGLQRFGGVGEITVGESAELILLGGDGGAVAVFAPGQWRWIEVAE